MTTELIEKKLENALFLTEDIKNCLHSDKKEDITGASDGLTGLVQRINVLSEETMNLLMEKATLEKIRAWSKLSKEKLMPINPVDTRCCFNVDTTLCDIVRRRTDVETASCVYGERSLEGN